MPKRENSHPIQHNRIKTTLNRRKGENNELKTPPSPAQCEWNNVLSTLLISKRSNVSNALAYLLWKTNWRHREKNTTHPQQCWICPMKWKQGQFSRPIVLCHILSNNVSFWGGTWLMASYLFWNVHVLCDIR